MFTDKQDSAAPQFSLVITILNECRNLPTLCSELSSVQTKLPNHEIIIVDDGSRDGSVQFLERIRRDKLPHLRILSHSKNYGKSYALRTAIRAARGRWIATLDGDGQDRPEDVARLVSLAERRPGAKQLIVGVRAQRRDGFFRLCATRLANSIRRMLLHDGCPDTGAPIKVFPRDSYLELPFFEGQHRFLPALLERYGCDLTCLEVEHRKRQHGRSHYTNFHRALDGSLDLLGVIWLLKRTPPPSNVKEWR